MRLFGIVALFLSMPVLSGCWQQAAAPASVPTLTSSASEPTPQATSQPAAIPPSPTPSQFDQAELQTGSAPPTPAPTPIWAGFEASQPVRVVIESIALDQPLLPVGLDENRLPVVPQHDVGWYVYSARPGEGDNVVLWGHVLRFRDAPDIPAPFARLNEVSIGSEITVYTANGATHRYIVEDLVWASPQQIEYILPQDSERLTLVSCIGDKVIINDAVEMTHRLITIAVPTS